MKHKNDLPSVDADALTQLAKQFPPATARPDEVTAEPLVAPPPPPPAPAPAPARRRGGGFTFFL
ncbi:MAG: hypothetical protein HQL41_15235, partial [Alphaproteobacteria bacterium]|nr:hypothetical protein [Alphaproteobacteria bacterium]